MKNLKYVILFFGLMMFSCANDSASSANTTETQTSDSIDGTYSYEETDFLTSITIRGSRWTGKTTLYGSSEYDSGLMKGNDLYDSSGLVEIGYVSGKTISTSMGGKRVNLSKK